MRRRILVTVVVASLAVLLVPQSASAVKPRQTCPPGFELGALTFQDALDLPATQRGLADGIYTVADIQVFFDTVDNNHNGLVCFKDVYSTAGEHPSPASGWQYDLLLIDDDASTP